MQLRQVMASAEISMLVSQLTAKIPDVLFVKKAYCRSLMDWQIGAAWKRLAKNTVRKTKSWAHPYELTACFCALLILSLMVAFALSGPSVLGSDSSAVPLSLSKTNPTTNSSLNVHSTVQLPNDFAGPLAPSTKPGSTGRFFVLKDYKQSSLAFEVNRGQTDPQVKFLSGGAGYALFFTPKEAIVVLPRLMKESPAPRPTPNAQPFDVLRMRFVGANRRPRIYGLKQLPGKVNYFIGNDPRQWRSGIPTYGQVRYERVYPGVGVVYYGAPGRLEYDLLIAPGTDLKIITLEFAGANQIRIDAQGDLRLSMPGGELVLGKPKIYQSTAGGRKTVRGVYVLRAGKQVGFQVGKYDHGQPLIIDPVLSYSTYLGGSGYDAGTAIALDGSGNAYVTGFTRSPNFPVTAGSFQTKCGTSGTCNGYFWDAFVTKLNASGQVIYSSFLGGSGNDIGKSIAVDATGAAYIAGQTFSGDFPTTTGAFKTIYRGAGDGFVAKINPSGTTVQYSTYLGGSGTDNPEGLAVDSSGNAYVTGQTYSRDFPTAAPIQASNGGQQDSDAFVTEINGSGTALAYSTYLGGSNMDWGNAIAVDSSGNAYIAGFTRSTDFPLVGTLQSSCGGCPGFADAFVTKVSPNGGALLHSTYLGGSNDDQAADIAIDPDGNIYVTGFTYSVDFPITPGAYQTSLPSGKSAAFVSKIAPDLSSLTFSTYVEGNGLNYGKSIAVDTGNVFVSGLTYSPTFPLVNATQSTCAPSNCYYGIGFITELNAAGSGLVFSTYLGGSHGDNIAALALDSSANVQVTGQATSTDFPTANAFQATFGGSYGDAFVTKISLQPAASLSPISLTFGSQSVGTRSAPKSVTLSSNGTAPLHITGISAGGDFTETNNCGVGVAAGSTCTISVTFIPTTSGTRTSTLTINSNSSGNPQTIALTGTATSAAAPAVSLSGSNLTWGNQAPGVTSAAQNVTMTNTGTATLSIAGISIGGTNPGDFAQTNDCGTSASAGASCTFSVTFTPTSSGNRSASLSISDNAGGSPHQVSLTGTSVGPLATLSSTNLSFGNQRIGTTSKAKTIQLMNTGNANLALSGIAITGTNATNFKQSNNCPNSLAPGAHCNINVTFAPTAAGTRTALLNVSDNAFNSPQTASLTGTSR